MAPDNLPRSALQKVWRGTQLIRTVQRLPEVSARPELRAAFLIAEASMITLLRQLGLSKGDKP